MSETQSTPVRHANFYSGCVQGVGFRYRTEQIAAKYAISGFVRNSLDGRVELVAEGKQDELERFEADLHQAMVDHIHEVKSRKMAATGEFRSFVIAF